MERLSPSFHCPWLSVMAVLVVVGSIPPGDLFFCFFFGKSAVFWGAAPPVARDLGGFGKALDGSPLLGPGVGDPTPKSRAPGAGNRPFCVCSLGALGRFLGCTGRFEPPHVTQTSDNVACWTSRALKYLKCHRTGRSNERSGGCAAKKPPFFFAETARTSSSLRN